MREQNMRMSVRWADGTFDAKRECSECHSMTCQYPVHTDYYKEIITKTSYSNWLDDNQIQEEI